MSVKVKEKHEIWILKGEKEVTLGEYSSHFISPGIALLYNQDKITEAQFKIIKELTDLILKKLEGGKV